MLIERAKRILLEPRAEWRLIANESASMDGLRLRYVLLLAAIPSLLQFLKLTITGDTTLVSSLASLVLGFALSLATIYLMAWIVNALAPRFNSKQDRIQSRKTIAYAYTASLLACVAIVAPGLWMVAVGAAALYAAYLLYLGLPATMKCPPENAAGYAAITVVIGVVLGLVASAAVNEIVNLGYDRVGSGPNANAGRPSSFIQSYLSTPVPTMDSSEGASVSEDAQVQRAVEVLAPERLKPFVPDSLLGRQRTNISVVRNKVMGVEISQANAYFTDESGRPFELQVTDLGKAKSLVGLASFVNVEEGESNAGSSYEKTYREGDDLVTEKWNGNTSTGEYSVLIADRFAVKITGQAYNIDELKAVTAELDLATLEGLVGGDGD